MTLPEFGALLANTYPNTSRYDAGTQSGDYVVWHEYSGRRKPAGPLVVQKIQVDLFTRIEDDPALGAILAALDGVRVAFDAPKTTYEPDTGYIHHIILCEVIGRG